MNRKTMRFEELPWTSDIYEGDKWNTLKKNPKSGVKVCGRILDI